MKFGWKGQIVIITKKYHIFAPTRPVDNVVIATKGLQDRNINIIAGTMVENKGRLSLVFVLDHWP